MVVAFSGGADSAFLAWVAHDTLGPSACSAVTAVSASLAGEEAADCAALAEEWGLRWTTVDHRRAGPARLRGQRHRPLRPLQVGADGRPGAPGRGRVPPPSSSAPTSTTSTTTGPGQAAAAERGAAFPLVDAGFTKAAVREASRRLGLRTWDKPAAACLASRVPYGTPVTLGTLDRVGRAEAALHRLGFRQVRVRHYGDVARLEFELADLPDAVARRTEVVAAVKSAGYQRVTVDLEGFRSGNLNRDADHRAAG